MPVLRSSWKTERGATVENNIEDEKAIEGSFRDIASLIEKYERRSGDCRQKQGPLQIVYRFTENFWKTAERLLIPRP